MLQNTTNETRQNNTKGNLVDLKLGCTRLIIDTCKKHALLRNQAAYALATAYHETAHTMVPVREMGGETYLKSKKYYPYVGMGFVQLTWEYNYKKATKELGVDFLSDPKKLLVPAYSSEILVVGMKDGWFTGKSLKNYITLSNSDFAGARRIINGTDKAALIAGYATQYDALLKAEGYGAAPAPGAVPEPTPVSAPKPVSTPAETPASSDKRPSLLVILFHIILSLFKGKSS